MLVPTDTSVYIPTGFIVSLHVGPYGTFSRTRTRTRTSLIMACFYPSRTEQAQKHSETLIFISKKVQRGDGDSSSVSSFIWLEHWGSTEVYWGQLEYGYGWYTHRPGPSIKWTQVNLDDCKKTKANWQLVEFREICVWPSNISESYFHFSFFMKNVSVFY